MKRSAPIARRTPLKTKTPMRSKAATPKKKRPPLVPCTFVYPSGRMSCKERPRVFISDLERYCKKHGVEVADRAAREFVYARDPKCVACGDGSKGVQWAHVHTRGMRYIRWDAENAVGLCSGCHFAYTKNPARWVKFVERTWPGRYIRTLRRELYAESQGYSVDVAEVIRAYRVGDGWRAPDPPQEWAA